MTQTEMVSVRHDDRRLRSIRIASAELTLDLFRGATGAWIVWHPDGVMERFESLRDAEDAFALAAALHRERAT